MGEKTRQIALFIFALLFAALAVAYYLYIVPVTDQKTSLQVQLEKLKQTFDQLQSAQATEPTTPMVISNKILEAIPVRPYADQLIKDLERLQSVSQISIEEASFSEREKLSAKELANQLTYMDQAEGGEAQATLEGEVQKLDEKAQKIAKSAQNAGSSAGQPKPAAGKEERQVKAEMIEKYLPPIPFHSVEISLKIKGDYKEIYRFVSEMQKMSRYLRVDQLDFKSNQKDEFVIPEDTKMVATVKLTSYFAPQFEKDLEKLPAVQVEGPAGKWDPMQYETVKKEEASVGTTANEAN
ncbi:type 4a pilus biogenesis protein PilO [Brevibacillus agri]|uniref:type 4a pilus biogenesis protein PilO n=1 Tax=Brevibacillus agri TaxID=51101 RepID=UPI0024C04108|nr:type 4a pilus biogenesis protein PilO [Brevibacillus agri]MED1642844.1 type 4a pilus biogenesis protein PilO [Brevibacillus agri]MED1653700.1 type 4a pilus biogenesis protein PilO [Brevibacillus agri]MED1688631.1 type 4a pilus biogenesis protein PilO [Brevibacillus agri]MED1691054.1 type 4a pilus biogenesis protein PilO [Brevibacillus agri]MED1700227.1 type 4a pilus biogenesis protein PilO [Brevibacillus agri]